MYDLLKVSGWFKRGAQIWEVRLQNLILVPFYFAVCIFFFLKTLFLTEIHSVRPKDHPEISIV